MQETSVLEAVVQRDRAIVITGLLVVIALAWMYILMGAGMGMTAFKMSSGTLPWQSSSEMAMPSHQSRPGATPEQEMGAMMRQAHMAMMQPAVWTPGYAVVMLVMWWVMMMAMMLPSASPMILIVARVNRTQKAQGGPFVPTSIFAAGYLVAWGVFEPSRHRLPVGTRTCWAIIRHAGEYERALWRTRADRGRHLPMHAAQACVSPALSQSVPIRDASLAHGDARCLADGYGSRCILLSVLLVFNGIALCGRHHESLLDSASPSLSCWKKPFPADLVRLGYRRWASSCCGVSGYLWELGNRTRGKWTSVFRACNLSKIAEQGFVRCPQCPLRSRFRQQLKPGVRSGEWRS